MYCQLQYGGNMAITFLDAVEIDRTSIQLNLFMELHYVYSRQSWHISI